MTGISLEKGLLVVLILILVTSPAAALEIREKSMVTLNSGSRDPSWSPDGQKITYTSGTYDIWTMETTGRSKKQLTNDIYRDKDPAWSPDGSNILYASEHDGSQQIWIMDADGTEKRQITSTDEWKSAPSWSPDGQKIAYVSGRYPEYDIWTMNLDGSGQKRLTYEANEDWAPVWSPEGQKIAYISRQSGNFDLWVMDADGANKNRVVEGVYWREPQISWSPDGRKLAYVSGQSSDYNIWTTDLEGKNPERLTFYSYSQLAPSWSPDGSKMAFTSDESGSYEIMVLEFQMPIALPPAEINPTPTSHTNPTPATPFVDSVPAPVIGPAEAPQIFENELVSKDDLTTQHSDKESTRNKDLSKESYDEKEELSVPRPDEDSENIIVPISYGEEDEIKIPETVESFEEKLDQKPISTAEEITSTQMKSETSKAKDWRDERFWIALLLAIPFAVLIWNSKYFTIGTGIEFNPSFAPAYRLASSVASAFLMTLIWF